MKSKEGVGNESETAEISSEEATRTCQEDLEEFLEELPKVELHVHFDGSLDPFLLYDYLIKNDPQFHCLPANTTLPWDGNENLPVRQLVKDCRSPQEFHALCECSGKHSLNEMLKCFEIFNPIVKGNLSLLEELAYDFCRRQAQQRVIYAEARYSPHILAKGATSSGNEVVDAEPVIRAVTKGFSRGQSDFGLVVKQILCCICWRPDWAADVVRLAHKWREDVVGIDIAAGEDHFDAEAHPDLYTPHHDAMKEAQRLGLNITIHAGEVGKSDNVKTSVQEYGATRIGHGYHVVHDKALMIELREKGVHIEVCPTSSLETGGWKGPPYNWTQHPALTMLENNLSLGFNSDDPAVFNTSLTCQMRIGLGQMKLSKLQIVRSVHESINAAFCTDAMKESLRQQVDAFVRDGTKTDLSRNVKFDDRVVKDAPV